MRERSKRALSILIVLALSSCVSTERNKLSLDEANEALFARSETVALGQLVAVAYEIYDSAKALPDANPSFPTNFVMGYRPIANLQASDSANGDAMEFYGHLIKSIYEPDRLIIAIRGTSDVHEWVDDAKVIPVRYSDSENFGHVEDGFKQVFTTFVVANPENDELVPLSDYLAALSGFNRMTVVGHSLGSSLATLVAFEARQSGRIPEVDLLTFASPRTGDKTFVALVESAIQNSVRVVNKPDLVPRVPPKILGYRHVDHEVELDSHENSAIKRSIVCYHNLQTYLHMLDPEIELADECRESTTP